MTARLQLGDHSIRYRQGDVFPQAPHRHLDFEHGPLREALQSWLERHYWPTQRPFLSLVSRTGLWHPFPDAAAYIEAHVACEWLMDSLPNGSPLHIDRILRRYITLAPHRDPWHFAAWMITTAKQVGLERLGHADLIIVRRDMPDGGHTIDARIGDVCVPLLVVEGS